VGGRSSEQQFIEHEIRPIERVEAAYPPEIGELLVERFELGFAASPCEHALRERDRRLEVERAVQRCLWRHMEAEPGGGHVAEHCNGPMPPESCERSIDACAVGRGEFRDGAVPGKVLHDGKHL
jgi:hypothetical protein